MSAGPAPLRIASWGGIGDALLATPAFRALKERAPDRRLIVYCAQPSHVEIYRHNPYIDVLRPPGPRSRVERFVLTRVRRVPVREPAYGLLRPTLFYTRHAVHIIGEMLGVAITHERLIVRLTDDEERAARALLAPYAIPIVIHVTSHFSANQHWPPEHWAALVERNPRYTFVQIGLPSERAVPGAVDLRGAVPLRTAMAVVKHAHSFVGVVSSFAHVTNAVGTPGVIFHGPSAAATWGYAHNVNLDAREPCAPCVDILGPQPCPYGSPCLRAISVRDVERALETQLAARTAPPAIAAPVGVS